MGFTSGAVTPDLVIRNFSGGEKQGGDCPRLSSRPDRARRADDGLIKRKRCA